LLALLVTALVLTAALLATLTWALGLLVRALIAAALLLATMLAALMLLAALATLVLSALGSLARRRHCSRVRSCTSEKCLEVCAESGLGRTADHNCSIGDLPGLTLAV
jgi:membrane protein implicated in regulation of membrane protease activity